MLQHIVHQQHRTGHSLISSGMQHHLTQAATGTLVIGISSSTVGERHIGAYHKALIHCERMTSFPLQTMCWGRSLGQVGYTNVPFLQGCCIFSSEIYISSSTWIIVFSLHQHCLFTYSLDKILLMQFTGINWIRVLEISNLN